jgi:hypothetical protein
MLLMEVVLLLLTVLSATDHLGVLANFFGLGDQWIQAPTQFTPGDVAICAVLVAGVIGSQGGRTWGRTAIAATMALVGYPLATSLLSELRSPDQRSSFASGHALWFNLVMIAELLIAASTLVALFATSRSGASAGGGAGRPAVAPGPLPGPTPGQPYPPQPAPGYAPPPGQPGYPAQPMQQQPIPQQPVQQQPMPQQPAPYPQDQQQGAGQQPAPGYSPPPVPPQAGPIQQPTPTQEALAYRPTQYAPPPGQPPAHPQGNPPVPPGA